MNIPTANVVVSYTAEAINSLFDSGGSTRSLLTTLEEQGDLLLFNKESNPNFISFEYEFGLGGGQHKAVLKILDPDNDFESRYFTKGFEENIAGFKSRPDEFLGENDPASSPTTRQEGMAQKTEFIKRFIESYGNKHLYVAFGSGFNTDVWAGPYKMYLTGASIDGSKGKVVTLQLTPTPEGLLPGDRRTAAQQQLNMSLNGLYSRTTGLSDQLNINLLKEERDTGKRGFDRAYEINLYDLGNTAGLGGDVQNKFQEESSLNVDIQKEFFKSQSVKAELAGINFHDMIVDCLKTYIRAATGKQNVIVILPNLNLLLLDFLEQETAKVLNEPSTEAQAFPGATSAPTGFGSFSYNAVTSRRQESEEIQQKFRWYKVIKQIVESLGFELVADDVKTGTEKDPKIESIPASKKVSLGPYTRAEDNFNKYLERYQFRVALTTRSSNLIPNHQETLKNVMDKLTAAMMGRYPLKPIVFTENNKKWLRYWGLNPLTAHHRTFAGTGTANKDIPFDVDQEAIIFGDLGVIQNYLYAQQELTERSVSNFREVKEVQDAKTQLQNLRSQVEDKTQQVLSLSANDPAAYVLNEQIADLKEQQADARFDGLNAAVAFAGQGSVLAPVDRSILNESYQRAVRETILPSFQNASNTPFGDLYEVPDNFALGKSALSEKDQKQNMTDLQKLAKDNNFPIFKYNTSNPNVVQLKADISNAYYAALRLGFSKAIGRQAAGVITGQVQSAHAALPILTVKDALQFLLANEFSVGRDEKKMRLLIQELEKRASASLIDDFVYHEVQSGSTTVLDFRVSYDAKTVAERIGIIALQQAKEGTAPTIMVDQEKPGSATSIMTSLISNTYRRAYNITLKTVPLFHLSDVGNTVFNNCLLFAQDPPISRTGVRPNSNFFNNFLSGAYQIMGFKHKIESNGEASSEFSLVGGPVATNINKEQA